MESVDQETVLKDSRTGDLLLCHDNGIEPIIGWLSLLIEKLSYSRYSHMGIIVEEKDLIDMEKITIKDPHQLYFLEASYDRAPDIYSGQKKCGVECVSLTSYLTQYRSGKNGQLYYRKLDIPRDNTFITNFKKSFTHCYNKGYDLHPWDWIRAKFDIEGCGSVQREDTFWCSALVGYIYVHLGILDKDIPWTLIAPRRFSHYENQELSFKYGLDPEKIITTDNKNY